MSWWSGARISNSAVRCAPGFAPRTTRRGQRRRRGRDRRRPGAARALVDRRVTRAQLRLAGVEERQILLQRRRHARAGNCPSAPRRSRRRSLGSGGLDAGRAARVSLAGDDGAEDPQAGRAGDVADDERAIARSSAPRAFCIRWMYVPAALDERLAMPQIGAQRHDARRWGRKLPRSRPTAVQLPQPLTIRARRSCAPGTFLTCRAFTSSTSKPRASRIS